MSGILETVEQSLTDFRPKTAREFVALQIARRFDDVGRLAQYLMSVVTARRRSCRPHAWLLRKHRDLRQTAELFFELIRSFAERRPHERSASPAPGPTSAWSSGARG